MHFEIGTAKMNAILSAVSKGVGKKYTLPITEYLQITLQDTKLTVTATDLTNFITYIDNEVEGEAGTAIVKADTLIKLVSKTTKDKMTFTKKEGHLEVKGNGKYKVELLEEDEFPTVEFNEQAEPFEVETAVLKRTFSTNKSAIATELIMPCLTGYNIGDKAITTDGIKMCINDAQLVTEPMLVSQTLADLLSTLTAEKVIIQKDGNKLLFSTHNIIIFGPELNGLEEYPNIEPILEVSYDAMTVLPKAKLLHAIDRLSIFVNSFDNSGIKLNFTKGHLILSDMKENSTEEIEMEQHVSSTGEDMLIVLNIDFLRDLLSVVQKDTVKIEYGEGLPVRIEEDDVTLILSTMEVSA